MFAVWHLLIKRSTGGNGVKSSKIFMIEWLTLRSI